MSFKGNSDRSGWESAVGSASCEVENFNDMPIDRAILWADSRIKNLTSALEILLNGHSNWRMNVTDEQEAFVDDVMYNDACSAAVVHIADEGVEFNDVKVRDYVDLGAGGFLRRDEDRWMHIDGGYGLEVTEDEIRVWLEKRKP